MSVYMKPFQQRQAWLLCHGNSRPSVHQENFKSPLIRRLLGEHKLILWNNKYENRDGSAGQRLITSGPRGDVEQKILARAHWPHTSPRSQWIPIC